MMFARLLVWVCFLSIAAPVCGQLFEILLPQVVNSLNGLTGNLTHQTEDFIDVVDGEFTANAVRMLSGVTRTIAKAVGAGKRIFQRLDSIILSSMRDNFVRDYNIGRRDEGCHLSCVQLIAKNGYPVETHENITTEDGYVLSLFRIPSGGPVVLIMHGLFASADDFVVSGPDNSIAYMLAREGYDVWLGNARGTKHSLRHMHLKPSQDKFWDFSWHDMGYYDLPAMIDYILNVTGQSKLKYIGHSQGSTCFWVMCSERPEYNDKVSLVIALAPIAFLHNLQSPILRGLLSVPGILNIFNSSKGNQLYKLQTCGGDSLMEKVICSYVVIFTTGFNLEYINATTLPMILNHAPSSSSAKQSIHYAQAFVTGKFRKFDYGVVKNMQLYASRKPPDYKLSNVKVPVALISSDEDWMSDVRDVENLRKQLPNVVKTYTIQRQKFGHIEYLYAKNQGEIFHMQVKKIISHF